ncbi:hypothetical protein MKEN_00477700 [Mycena kentingensis (nom. inval.)]|nr:hypothetical protein MKEN_00477700 [Mycena kentingensis (nom. inval.)]
MPRDTSAPSKRPAPTSTTVDAQAEAAPVWSKVDVRDIRARFPLRKSGILALLDHHGGVLRAVDALAALFKPEGDYSRGVALAGSLQHDVDILYGAFRGQVKRRGVVGLLNRLESAFEVERLLREMFPEAAALGGEDEGRSAPKLAAVDEIREDESEVKTTRKTKRKRDTTTADDDEDELEERTLRRQRLSRRTRESPEIEIVEDEGEENEAPSTPPPARNTKSHTGKRSNPADLFTPEPEHPRPHAQVYVLVPAVPRRKNVAKYDSDSDREMLRTPTPPAAPHRRWRHSKSPAPPNPKGGSSLIQELVCKDNSRLQREMERNRRLTLVEQARERGELRRRAGPLREWNTDADRKRLGSGSAAPR